MCWNATGWRPSQTGAQTLLRVTGDAPLIDPGLIDYLVSGMTEAGADFVQLEAGRLVRP